PRKTVRSIGRRAACARHASSASRLPWMSVKIAISTPPRIGHPLARRETQKSGGPRDGPPLLLLRSCCCYCFGAGAVAGRFAGAWLVVAGRELYCSNDGAFFSSSFVIERRSLKLSWSLLLLALLPLVLLLLPL